MANTYTGTATITNQTGITNLVTTAYDKYVEFALRAMPLFRDVADKRPVNVTGPGSAVTFQIYNDLAAVSATLTENVDPDAVALSNTSTVTVTLNEYGNVVLETEKLVYESLSDIDPGVANIVAYNMRDSLDGLVLSVLRQGTNVSTSNAGAIDATAQATNTLTASDIYSSSLARYIPTALRTNAAVPRRGDLYWCAIHPNVSYDLRSETGAAGWRQPHEYGQGTQGNIWAGEIGTYEGAYYIETPRAYVATDGAASAKVYRTIYAGQQALAEAVAYEPHVVLGPIVDKLMRARPIGWKGLLGWARYREASLWRVESGASVGN